MRRALDRARRAGRLLAVLLIDADDAGRIDRACGHEAGDAALAELERRLAMALPRGGSVVGLGRTRFVAAVEAIDERGDALELARSLADVARAPLHVGDVRVRLDATVGVALALDGGGTAAALLRDADAAARQARDPGGAPWRLADPAAHERALRRLRLEDELADALAQGQLALYFQPILSLRRGTLAGVEALVRWQHPDRGLLGPAQFLPAAEESGLIVEIGAWVLDAVCLQLSRWSAGHPELVLPAVAINVSARELLEQTFATRFATTLLAAHVPPEALTLEISDASVLDAHRDAEDALGTLRRLGVGIVLDRFGSTRNSLAQLARLPIDGLKLEPALLGGGHADLPIAAAVVELAHALGMSITVPGIESERQLEAVRALRADAAQGHLIARPAPATSLADLHELELGLGAGRRGRAGTRSGDEEELLSLSAVADALGVSTSTARRLADQGVLPGTRTEGGHRRFRRSDVQRLARERRRTPLLRPWELPAQPLPATAELIAHEGKTFAERAGRALYEPARPGWFATPPGAARGRAWLDALGGAFSEGEPREALVATAAYGAAALLGGASVTEVVRFLGQFGAIVSHELVRTHAAGEEGRALQRLMTAATEAFLERL